MIHTQSRTQIAAGAAAVLFLSAVLARPLGTIVVVPLLVAASAASIHAAMMGTALARNVQRLVLASFALRWALALFFYLGSLYGWPIGRSLQAGHGFWLFCMDALNYHTWAPRVMEAVAYGMPLPDPGAGLDYYLIVALEYAMFGVSPLVAIAVNILAWTLATIFLIALFARLRAGAMPITLVAVVALWPSGLIWPTQLMKDSLQLLFVVLAATAIVRAFDSEKFASWFLAANGLLLTLLPLVRLRVYVARIIFFSAVVATLVALAWMLKERRRSWKWVGCGLMAALVTHYGIEVIIAPDPFTVFAPRDPMAGFYRYARAAAEGGDIERARRAYGELLATRPDLPQARAEFAALPVDAELTATETRLNAEPLGRRLADAGVRTVHAAAEGLSGATAALRHSFSAMSLQDLDRTRHKFAATGGTRTVDAALSLSWRNLIWLTPRAMANALVAPFPWEIFQPRGVTGPFRTFAVFESLLVVLLLPSMVVGIFRARRPHELLIAALACGGLLGLGLTITNIGTLFRLRAQFILLLVGFAAYGFDVYAWAAQRVRTRPRLIAQQV